MCKLGLTVRIFTCTAIPLAGLGISRTAFFCLGFTSAGLGVRGSAFAASNLKVRLSVTYLLY